MGRRGDVDGLGRVHEPGRVEGGIDGGVEGLVRTEPGQRPRRRRPDTAQLALVGGGDAVQQVPGQQGVPRCPGQYLLGRQRLVAIDPGQDGAHVSAVEGGGMQEGGQEGLGPLRPVRAVTLAALIAGRRTDLDQRSGHGEGPRPRPAGLERGPPQRSQPSASRDRAGGVEEEASTEGRSRLHGGIEDIGLGGRRHHGTVGRQHIGDDQRRGLPRARWTEDHHRMLRWSEAPTPLIVAEIRAVSGARRSIQRGAMTRCDALWRW